MDLIVFLPIFAEWKARKDVIPPAYRRVVDLCAKRIIARRGEYDVSKNHLTKLCSEFIELSLLMLEPFNRDEHKHYATKCYGLMKDFVETREIQDEYINANYNYIPEKPLTNQNVTYGYYAEPEELIKHALTLDPILLQRILDEPNILRTEPDNWTCNIEDLCGCEHRRKNMIGTVRLLFGIDEMTPYQGGSKKTLMCYMDISNYPIKMRRHNESGYTFAILEGDSLERAFEPMDPLDMLKPAMASLTEKLKNLLENGIDFTDQKGTQHHLRVTISGFCGDNKGSHQLMGLPHNFGTGFRCRNCEGVHSNFRTDDPQPWIDCEYSETENPHPHSYREFVFEGLQDVTAMKSFPHDGFHDLVQGGVIENVFKQLVFPALGEKDTIRCIAKHRLDTGRMDVKFTDKEAKFTTWTNGSCKLELLARFDQFFGDVLGKLDADLLELIRALQDFSRLAFDYKFSYTQIAELKRLSLLVYRKSVDCELHLVPKNHFLLHYVKNVKYFGRMVYYSTTRYERMHQIHKKFTKKSKNSINIVKSLMKKCQLQLALRESVQWPDDPDYVIHAAKPANAATKVSRSEASVLVNRAYQLLAVGDQLSNEWLLVKNVWADNNTRHYAEGHILIFARNSTTHLIPRGPVSPIAINGPVVWTRVENLNFRCDYVDTAGTRVGAQCYKLHRGIR